MIEATRGMSGDEVAAFHEKMQKMNKFLEDELVELEEQKTKLMVISYFIYLFIYLKEKKKNNYFFFSKISR